MCFFFPQMYGVISVLQSFYSLSEFLVSEVVLYSILRPMILFKFYVPLFSRLMECPLHMGHIFLFFVRATFISRQSPYIFPQTKMYVFFANSFSYFFLVESPNVRKCKGYGICQSEQRTLRRPRPKARFFCVQNFCIYLYICSLNIEVSCEPQI